MRGEKFPTLPLSPLWPKLATPFSLSRKFSLSRRSRRAELDRRNNPHGTAGNMKRNMLCCGVVVLQSYLQDSPLFLPLDIRALLSNRQFKFYEGSTHIPST